ncbi:MAG: NAD-dependent deacylase [Marinobacter sp.]|nr:NAD-dependent deacylase [Marinobacter sp.]
MFQLKEHIVVISGAGISAESGISTFRDSNGLWEQHSIYDVATPEGFKRNPGLVLDFYNQRRRQLQQVDPNAAHRALADLQSRYRVTVVTQNIDDLHERAGSADILHLHGEIIKARSSRRTDLVYEIGYGDIRLGDTCELGSQLRPHVVWFGEDVPLIAHAAELVASADHLLVIGTSLQVYPAAGLVDLVGLQVPVTVIDPAATRALPNARVIRETATQGIQQWISSLNKP